MYQEHPEFLPPIDPDASIWRYVDLARFLSMLTTRSLYLSRADRLGDPFEGSISRATIETYNDPRNPTSLPGLQETMRRMRDALRRNVAVNCWYVADRESVAMWKMYATRGIAIRSTYSRLVKSLEGWPTPTYVGLVKYVDYETSVVGSANFLSPFAHKRCEFASEQELRVVVSQLPASSRDGALVLDYSVEMPAGILAPADLGALVESVFLAPETAEWQSDAIADVTKSLGHAFSIYPSVLDREALLG